MFSCHSFPIVDRIFFRCFGKSCFVCIVLPFVDISLIFLLWSVLSGLFPQVVLLFFPVSPVPFSRSFQGLSFSSFGLVFVVFLFVFPVEFPIPVFDCFFELFEGNPIFSQTNFYYYYYYYYYFFFFLLIGVFTSAKADSISLEIE